MANDYPVIVSDQRDLSAVVAMFELQQRFPSLPIIGMKGRCWVFSFDDILSSRFVERLDELVGAYGDESVEVLAVDQPAQRWGLLRVEVIPEVR